ncbi:MAG: hypothetical protein M1596_01955 [Firmicutes bacterium]|nr:hypothetical protein [Bacillota bacterium]
MLRRYFGIGATIIIVGGGLYGLGYRWSPSAAAFARSGGHSREFGVVRHSWGEVVLLQTPKGPRTELVQREGFLWHDTANVVFTPKKSGPIHTIGWLNDEGSQHQITVIAVVVASFAVAYVEAGPDRLRQRRSVTVGNPLIFAWNYSIPANQLHLDALSKQGTILYKYVMEEHRTSDGSIISTGRFHWVPVRASS